MDSTVFDPGARDAQCSVPFAVAAGYAHRDDPGQDFPFMAPVHLDEHPLALTVDHLVELRDAVVAMGDSPVYEQHDDFIVFP